MKDERINGTRIKCYATPEKPGDFDRFTVVYVGQVADYRGHIECVGLSGHASCQVGRHLGKRVPFASLPEHLQSVVMDDTKS